VKGGLFNRMGGLFMAGAVVLVLVSPAIVWSFLPERPGAILVIDKTVPVKNYREHYALFWTLNHLKVLNVAGRWFPDTDYLGWYPDRIDAEGHAVRIELEKDALRNKNAVFIADSYGVYLDDLAETKPKNWTPDYSQRMFGGFSLDEASYIEDFVNQGGNVVGEYNTFASPTSGEARRKLERLFGARWTDWAGRYFKELSDMAEVPAWARRNYAAHYGEEWKFRGHGWVITNEDTRIVVLQSGLDTMGNELEIRVVKKGNFLMTGLPEITPYYYWFDIVIPASGAVVPAEYVFSLTTRGSKKLERFDLPLTFPAIVMKRESPLVVYAAGDFSDNNIDKGAYWIAGKAEVRGLLSGLGGEKSQSGFFWRFYVPYIKNVVSNLKRGR
jgi:hypothetical protein